MHEGRIVEDGGSRRDPRDPQDEYTQMLLSHYADPRAEVVSLPGLPGPLAARDRRRAQQATVVARTVGSRERSAAQNPIVVDHRRRRPTRRRVAARSRCRPSATCRSPSSRGSRSRSSASRARASRPSRSCSPASRSRRAGTVRFGDLDVAKLGRGRGLRDLRSEVQMVFQDPYSALNPLHTVEYTLTRPVVNYTGLRGAGRAAPRARAARDGRPDAGRAVRARSSRTSSPAGSGSASSSPGRSRATRR